MNTAPYSDWTCGSDSGFSDTRVSRLALEAANQIDELIKGRSFNVSPVLQFAELIKASFAFDSATGAKNFIDSGTVALFLHASEDQPKNFTELVGQAMNLATELRNTGTQSTNLQRLRDFCLAISKAARSFCEIPQELEEAL